MTTTPPPIHHPIKSYNTVPAPVELESSQNESSTVATRHMIQCLFFAILYIISGISQPLLMNVAKDAGLANSSCQIYMLFYYIGPALVSVTYLYDNKYKSMNDASSLPPRHASTTETPPSWSQIGTAAAIGIFDIIAQTINYTGSIKAGPTIFAIIYSSVTVWTATYSAILLKRRLNISQWTGVFVVFGGLAITGFESTAFGANVFRGAMLIVVGSSMHALQYVLSEAVMTRGVVGGGGGGSKSDGRMASGGERLSPRLNCSVQGVVGSMTYLLWQVIYTRKHFDELLGTPMKESGTGYQKAIVILLSLSVSNLIHAMSFFYTLKNFPGGSVSAGVMKGLQAVLVFVATAWLFCGQSGGQEMCFTRGKVVSLVIVLTGVFVFAKATEIEKGRKENLTAAYKIIAADDHGNQV